MLYLAALCPELGFTLEGVALTNLKKPQSRQSRGKIHESGDVR